MASSIIHICVAKKINEKLKMNEKLLFLGSIAPDVAKHIGESKVKGHFLNNSLKDDVPDINQFLALYKTELNKPFDLGYFVHLYTDKLWLDKFISSLVVNNSVKLVDGTIVQLSKEEIRHLIYNDYVNINIELIDKYNLDLSLFYEDVVIPNSKIKEIPLEKLPLLIDQAGITIKNSNKNREYIFDINSISIFIDECAKEIYQFLLNNYAAYLNSIY